MPARREAVLLQLGQKAMAQEEARRFFNGIRSFWVGSAAPTEETVARWVLQAHPIFFFSSRRRHTSSLCDWSSDVCSSDLQPFRVERVAGTVLWPTPGLRRHIERLAAGIDAGFVVLDPALPLGAVGPQLAIPYLVVAHGAEIPVAGRIPVVASVLARVLRKGAGAVAGGNYAAAEIARAA